MLRKLGFEKKEESGLSSEQKKNLAKKVIKTNRPAKKSTPQEEMSK